MNIRDIVYETAKQFSEIAASQHWIEARIGDLNRAAQEVTEALRNQQAYFNEALGIAREKKKKRGKIKKKPTRKATRKRKRKSRQKGA